MRTGSRPDSLSDHDGAAAVEFAIIAPLLFMLMFGIIQFGIFFAQDLALSNAARQAARAAAVPSTGNCGDIFAEARQGAETIALNRDNPSFDVSVFVPDPPAPFTPGLDVCPGGPPSPNDPAFEPCTAQPPGSEVVVTVKYDANLAIPLFGDLGLIELEREGSYRCEFN